MTEPTLEGGTTQEAPSLPVTKGSHGPAHCGYCGSITNLDLPSVRREAAAQALEDAAGAYRGNQNGGHVANWLEARAGSIRKRTT